ncbi:hypothetical protein K4F52_005340 [Lecanicillium sp. MT-2017a]|nr:hypothetical protein K4F52_005340 [Lecanicillium sp. MT-2017a]
MARSVHWTHDPNFSHLRNPPVWYHYQRMPLYTPSPAARMEKRLAEERRAQWQWYDTRADKSVVNRPCTETCLFPCGVYGRTWARLKAALAGHDAGNIPDPGVFNSDCFEYALCFPFYGCFVSRLQATVRSFYGIDGDDTAD